MDNFVITFPSVYHAFSARKVLEEAGIDAKLIPVPRQLSGSCEGLAACFDENLLSTVLALLDAKGIEIIKRGVKVT